jgi:histidinol-phosphate aminotransferase
MRIGLAFGAREMIAGLMKVKDSYNLNRLSAIAATAALQDQAWMKRNVARIQRARRQLTRRLTKLGFSVSPSQANFVLARRRGYDLRPLYEHLKSRKILVRYFDVPALKDALRITVGTPQQVQVLARELETAGVAS